MWSTLGRLCRHVIWKPPWTCRYLLSKVAERAAVDGTARPFLQQASWGLGQSRTTKISVKVRHTCRYLTLTMLSGTMQQKLGLSHRIRNAEVSSSELAGMYLSCSFSFTATPPFGFGSVGNSVLVSSVRWAVNRNDYPLCDLSGVLRWRGPFS